MGLISVFALDKQNGNAVDEKDYILAITVPAIVDRELFGDLIHIPARARLALQISIVNDGEIQFAALLRTKEFAPVAEVIQKITIAVDIGMQAAQLSYQRAFGFFVFGVKLSNFGIQQIVKEEGGAPGGFLGRSGVTVKAPTSLGFRLWHIGPANLLGVTQQPGLNGLML